MELISYYEYQVAQYHLFLYVGVHSGQKKEDSSANKVDGGPSGIQDEE